jgi:hypothetical protein
MKSDNAERFEGLLAALEQELIAATDEEILAAAGELGMNPAMKGSAAFIGVTRGSPAPFTAGEPREYLGGAGVPRGLKNDR